MTESIEVTPEMIEAAQGLIHQEFKARDAYITYSNRKKLAAAIYRAMHASSPQTQFRIKASSDQPQSVQSGEHD